MKRLLSFAVLGLCLAAPAFADLALATSKNCMSCHAVDRKVLGPAFKDVAAKYKGNAGAADMLAAKIIKGGSGVWGPVPMPPNPNVKDDDVKKMIQLIMALKK